ncbi:hypothetical protein BCR34DRAFT_601768 [Clohesyomyces aquaticus]|uniref:RRM domain-containing protein n=1 Tax=Clohesyomyces aquaticus TaxID=1231657 RepID=A0A1Y1ZKS7_9PLEO|nr:hypothetical protein BCR34DRAFT_601768 [Clohesyomyces aquaticus]
MAPEDLKTKKRKGATDTSPKPKKQKKSDAGAAAAKQSAKALKSAVEPLDAVPSKVPAKASRARAQDFFDPEVAPKDETAKEKKHKKKNQAPAEANGSKDAVAVAISQVVEVQEKPKKGKKTAAAAVKVAPAVETPVDAPKKAKKGKKGKTSNEAENPLSEKDVVAEVATAVVDAPAAASKPEPKKAQKGKTLAKVDVTPVTESNGTEPEAPLATEVSVEPAQPKPKRGRKPKASAKPEVAAEKDTKDDVPAEVEVPAPSSNASKKSKKEKASIQAKPVDPKPDVEVGEDVAEDDKHEDDQTAALLAGFDSDNDEDDGEDKDFDGTAKPIIPSDLRKELNTAIQQKNGKRGVVFIGRLPTGFFEPQMKAYFAQFGTVTRLRLSRNKKTGASKHYAFVEFASEAVADIVAKTMDKYLLFGHLLQCRTIPEDQVHADLFKGANARFKVMPRNKIAGAELKRGAEREVWEKRVGKETAKRAKMQAKLKEKMGYDFTVPQLKTVEDVPMKDAAIDDEPEQQLLTEEADGQDRPTMVVEVTRTEEESPGQLIITETVKTKKSKKGPKAKSAPVPVAEANKLEEVTPVEAAPVQEKKAKKGKKAKVEPIIDLTEDKMDDVEITAETKKGKKAKKVAPAESLVDEAVKAVAAAVKEKKRKAKPIEEEAVAAKPKKAKKAKASAT